jgi:natural product biosynthesis luciferase-like monooxygenase protein
MVLPVDVSAWLATDAKEKLDSNDYVLAAFTLYLTRIIDNERFDLSISSTELREQVEGFEEIFATQVQLHVDLNLSDPASETLSQVLEQIAITTKHKTFSRDMKLRYPELTATQDAFQSPIVFAQISDQNSFSTSPGTELLLRIKDSAQELEWVFDTAVYTSEDIRNMQQQFTSFLGNLTSDEDLPLGKVSLLSNEMHDQILYEWNDTAVDYPREKCIHNLFEDQAALAPDAIAVVFEKEEFTYRELNERANRLARVLQRLDVGPGVPVGIYMERSLEMLVALLGVLKAGGAYLPLDPEYPSDRIAFMVEDAQVPILLTQGQFMSDLPPHQAQVIPIDASWDLISFEQKSNVESSVTPADLSYIIYTSGSTGKPKGVMVQHGNVVNFFAGMDERIAHDPPGTWLAVTSLSFDISVLEFFWTLARGFKLILYSEKSLEDSPAEPISAEQHREIDFSLFYFSSDESEQGVADKYRLLIEGAKFADQNGFSAVWTPERHFHAFGGLYPNPSVASAAIAAITENVRIRTGSCVLPLHSPIRVAEEWAVVDNISKGRVGISFAAGWQPNDFVLKPENHADRKAIMFRDIEVVRQLWRGETVTFPGPNGDDVEVRTLPRPVQAELPIWVTAAGNPETFRMAGAGGFNILTHLLGQSVEELAEKVNIYREAWEENDRPGAGHVTLMLHTLVGEDVDEVRELARKPMTDYLRSAVGLVKKAAWHFPAFKDVSATNGKNPMEILDSGDLPEEDMEALLNFSFERYYETSGLFGTPETALNIVNQLKAIGVDEIGCLIDFGVDSETVMNNLKHLNRLKDLAEPVRVPDYSVASQIQRHGVTHMQCTPSMAGMFLLDEPSREAISDLEVLMVGGEAFPPAMAGELSALLEGEVINMYGPTETTVWSSTYPVTSAENPVSIGRPIVNTDIYILDDNFQPVPIGIAGDLYIGGDGVVRGYLNRPELTAERFIQHPFSDEPGSRVYHTGDLARYREDGNIEFLGRLDHQIKLRGHRIELGEIEILLTQHPQVRETVVIAREDVPGDLRLVAYLIPEQKKELSSRDLRDYLRERLPEFMIPASYVTLDAFPQTPNRKIDRKALPAPDQARPDMDSEYIAPRTPLEKTLATIWSEILNVDRIGVQDNFFELGGHSLSAVQVAFRVRRLFGVDLPLQSFFRVPTLAGLAQELEDELLIQAEDVELEELAQEIENMSDEEVELLLAGTTND